MKTNRLVLTGVALTVMLSWPSFGMAAGGATVGTSKIKHVLLLSIDGMHAVDFYNCAHGIAGLNDGAPYCPNLSALGQTGINYVAAISSKPSDSFPGLTALIAGGSPRTTGIYYDVAYDRSLNAPAETTSTGLAAGRCTPGATTGTTTDYDQGIDFDSTKLNGGAPGAGLTEGGAASIDPQRLVRDPQQGCAPVYPWNFIRTNTIFGVVHAAGGYTAWIDKHPSYAFVAGPGGTSVNDLYTPEVNSTVVALPGVQTAQGASCATIRDPNADLTSWTNSFANIQCYDAIKVNALLNEIAGKTHNGAPAVIPAVFGMNFQSVYIGQSLNEPGAGSGGYQNSAATPSSELLQEIEDVDASIGQIVSGLKDAGIYENTLVIVTAKHGESPIDPTRYVADGTNTPATLLGDAIPYSESPLNPTGIGPTEDDVSVLWLKPGASVTAAVTLLEENATAIGMGEIFSGPTLALNYNVGGLGPGLDPRTPDIIVTPNVGVTYSSSTTMIGDHGGFGHDDNNVVLLVALPSFAAQTVSAGISTAQVAPTILSALGLDPTALDAVKAEGTPLLPQVGAQLAN
jgi:hypothetical protein